MEEQGEAKIGLDGTFSLLLEESTKHIDLSDLPLHPEPKNHPKEKYT